MKINGSVIISVPLQRSLYSKNQYLDLSACIEEKKSLSL